MNNSTDFNFENMGWDFLPPSDQAENVRYRIALREWACKSPANQRWIIDRCRRDICFFINSFICGHDPRPRRGLPPVVPFILREHQVGLIKTMKEHLGYRDIGVRKSRGEGLSFLSLMLFLHSWLFEPNGNFMIVARTELTADSDTDSSSLGWKLSFMLKLLPEWLAGKQGIDWIRIMSRHAWVNRRNGTQIVCTSNTADVGAGGRCTAILLDEFARFAKDTEILTTTEPVSDCRIYCSTFVGTQNEFYRLMNEPSNLIKDKLLWRDNPDRNQSMFIVDAQKRVLRDPKTGEQILASYGAKFMVDYYPILRKRGFDMTNKEFPLNPWCVSRMIRPRMTPTIFAQEYEGIVADTDTTFFPITMIEGLLSRARDPDFIGDVFIHEEKLQVLRISRRPEGPFRLYHGVMRDSGRPAAGSYTLGVDVSYGLGGDSGSNSVISILNNRTGVKVGEFVSPITPPERLAEVTIALAQWFVDEHGHEAYVVFEANGPGAVYGRRLEDAAFGNVHYRRNVATGRGKPRKEPGFWTSESSKPILLGKYRMALETGLFDNPSREALDECLSYKVTSSGRLEFARPGVSTGRAGDSHADMVIADALAFYGAEELGGGTGVYTKKSRAEPDLTKAPPTSFGYRQYQRRRAEKKARKAADW